MNRQVNSLMLLLVAVSGVFSQQQVVVRICVTEHVLEDCEKMAKDITTDTFQCIKGIDTLDCLSRINKSEADVMNIPPEDLYTAGKYFGLQPLSMEQYNGELYRYLAVAVVPKDLKIDSLEDLKGKKSCHTGVGRTAGWNVPVGTLLSKGIMKPDCEGGIIESVSNFFSESCAAGNWVSDPVIDAQLKKENANLCKLCKTDCSPKSEYFGYEGALRCLEEGGGDVAFTKDEAVKQYLTSHPEMETRFEYLCTDATRKPLTETKPCDWAERPTNVFVYNPHAGNNETLFRTLQKNFLKYNSQKPRPSWFDRSLVSSPNVTDLLSLKTSEKTWDKYLGRFKAAIELNSGQDDCQGKDTLRLCVTKGIEEEKCEALKMVAFSRRIRPELKCVSVDQHLDCLDVLETGKADFVTLDAGDLYQGGRYHKLKPVASEKYGNEPDGVAYYAVAVVKTADHMNDVKLADFKGKRSCHTGIGRTAGWVIPVGRMVVDSLVPKDECNRPAAVAKFFSGSCVPGARNKSEQSTADVLCSVCIGDENGNHKCERSSKERYNGYAGAFRCLAEDAGDIAFVNHKTVPANTDGKNPASWAKNLRSEDFRLLCRQGGLSSIYDYRQCNLGEAPAHYVAMAPDTSDSKRLLILRFLLKSGQIFKSGNSVFTLFGPFHNTSNLLFKDDTIGFEPLQKNGQSYKDVLGDYFAIAESIDPKACHGAGSRLSPIGNGLMALTLMAFAILRTILFK